MGNGDYLRPVPDKLISHKWDDIAFFVTKHPTNPDFAKPNRSPIGAEHNSPGSANNVSATPGKRPTINPLAQFRTATLTMILVGK